MTALASSAIRAFCDALSIRPMRRRKRRNASELMLKVYESSQNHWNGVSAHMTLSLKTAQQDLGKDEQQFKRRKRG